MSGLTRLTKFSLAAGAATAALAVFSPGAMAQARAQEASANAITIQSQDLDDALRALARQTGTQIVFEPSAVRGRTAPAVAGVATPEQALSRLLTDSGLTYRSTGVGTFTILVQATEARPTQTGAENSASDAQEEEIVVTAQKREERLADVPVSITALSGAHLDEQTAEGVSDAIRSVPGVAVSTDRNGMGAIVGVRGVTSGGLFSGATATAYYLDDAPFSLVRTGLTPDANAYDLERVEVLRGPQGTLYGASALNGVVRVLTHRVDLEDVSFKARGTTSLTEDGGDNYRADAALNIPIIPDRLGARITAGYQDFSGWIDRTSGDDQNDSEIGNLRLRLEAQPTNELTLGFSTWAYRGEFGAPNTSDANQFHSAGIDEPSSVDYDVHNLTASYDFGPVSLSSSTSYLDFSSSNVLDYGPFCCVGVDQVNNLDSNAFTEELLLTADEFTDWRWSLGLFYREADDHTVYFLNGLVPGPLGFDDGSRSTAIFGEVTRVFFDGRFEITGGLRHFRDEVTTADNSPGGTSSDEASFEHTAPRLVFTWHPSDGSTVYASYTEGFRSGALQSPEVAATGLFPAAEPDVLRSYELGLKRDLFNRALTVEAAAYFIEWEDISQILLIPLNSTIYSAFVNAGTVSGPGFDLSLVARPTNQWSLGAAVSWNDLSFEDDVGPFSSGERPNFSPEFTGNAFVSYEFAMGGGYSGELSSSLSYTSSINSAPSVTGDDILLARASFRLNSPDNWNLSLFADNLTNEQGVSQPDTFLIPSWDTRPRPRTVGLQIELSY